MGIWVYSATHLNPISYIHSGLDSKVGLPTLPPAPRLLLHSSTSPSHPSTLPPFTRPRNHPRSRRFYLLCIVSFRVFDTSGHLGIPRHPLKSNSTYPLRSNSREWVFGYTHRIPYTHPPWSISAVDLQKHRRVEGVPQKSNCRLLIYVSITLFWPSWGPPHGAHPYWSNASLPLI